MPMGSQPIRVHHFDSSSPVPPPPTDDRNVRKTKWYRESGAKVYSVEMTGLRAYQIIQFLERIAVSSTSYRDISEAVKLAEMIREQTTAGESGETLSP